MYMILNKLSSTLLVLVLITSHLSGQDGVREDPFIGIGCNMGVDFSLGELGERYGRNMHAGLSLRLFSIKQKGFLAIEGITQYGTNVKEDVLAPLRLESGVILGNDGQAADLFLRQRGIYLGLHANRIIISSANNPFAGLGIGLGIGLWQHHIKFLDERSTVQQLAGDYAKGYDRSTRGPALKQTISYEHIGTNRSLNYSIGLTLMEGFTKSIRAINFDTGLSDTNRRLNLMIGLEATWYLPIKDFAGQQEVFY